MYPKTKEINSRCNEANRRKAKQLVATKEDLFSVSRTKIIKKKIAQLRTKPCCSPYCILLSIIDVEKESRVTKTSYFVLLW